MAVYILKIDTPLGNENHQAQYYMGYCKDNRLAQRLAEHRAGYGAAMTSAAIERGYSLELIFVIPKGTRKLERQLKNWKSHRKVLNRFPSFRVLHPVR